MTTNRRDFLSAAAASALAMRQLHPESGDTASNSARREDPRIAALEAKAIRARPVPLDKVRLLGGPLKHAQDITAKYLLSLEPDRMLAFYRMGAGLPKKAEPYGGWDGPGHNLTGHIAGHYLSAVSLMYLATGDARFKDRATYLVQGLKEVQDKHGDGYLVAIQNGREAFGALSKGDIRSAAFDLNGMWSPWYTLHKTFAGLRDAYRHTGNRTALDVETKFAAWAERTLAPLNDSQIQRMLNTEFGGMNEILSDLYADTGDRRWLDLSYKFEHRAFTDALKRHQDNLSGKHGNCQIPKLIGAAARYIYTGTPEDLVDSTFFWDRVVQHHTYASGGHGLEEYFGPPDQLSKRVDGRAAESCNVYNMVKLTRTLFSLRPDAFYADFHERALFNHVLASIDPEDGRVSYMVPVGHREEQEYQDPLNDFTCCCGTGMENHALHGYGVYYESPSAGAGGSGDGTVWVNLFVPTTAELASIGGSIRMDTGFPDGDDARLTLTLAKPREFTLAVRRPSWAGDGFSVKVNGTAVPVPTLASMRAGGAGGRNVPGNEPPLQPSSFVELKRAWKTGDTVDIVAPKSLRLEPTPDDRHVAAVMWGPLVLAGDMGPRRDGRQATPPPPVPVLVGADKPVSDWLVAAGRPGDFTAKQVARLVATQGTPGDASLAPFYRTHRRQYSVYWDVVTPAEFDARAAAIASERERVRQLEAATIAYVQPGDSPAETKYNYQTDTPNRQVQRGGGRSSRGGTGWFSYELPLDGASNVALVITYNNPNIPPPVAPDFDIQVDGNTVAKYSADANAAGFYDATYAVPANLVQGKTKLTVRFQAASGGRIAPIYGVRVVRK